MLSFRASSSLLLLLVALVLCSDIQGTWAGNCSLIAPMTIERDNTQIVVAGSSIRVNPKSSGVVYTGAGIHWELYLLVERAKVNKTALGFSVLPQQYFVQPVADFGAIVDPLEPYVPDQPCTAVNPQQFPCSPILNYIYIEEMDCWAEREKTLFHGLERESIYVYFTHPVYNDFKLTAEHHVLNDTLVIPRKLNNTNLPSYESYLPNTLKLSYTWENFPWVGGDNITFAHYNGETFNNASVMTFWANFTGTVPYESILSFNRDPVGYNVSIRGIDHPLVISLDVTTVYTVENDYSWLAVSVNRTDTNVTYTIPENFDVFLQSSSATENENVGHWKKLTYDPNMGALFASPIDSSPPGSPPSKSNTVGGLAAWKVGLIAASVVAIVIAAFVLTIIFVPAARILIRPFTQRNERSLAGGNTGQDRGSGWRRASGPSRTLSNH